jgi:hypothetical protein
VDLLTTFYSWLHERVFESPAVIQLANKFLLWNPKGIAVYKKACLLGYYPEPNEANQNKNQMDKTYSTYGEDKFIIFYSKTWLEVTT